MKIQSDGWHYSDSGSVPPFWIARMNWPGALASAPAMVCGAVAIWLPPFANSPGRPAIEDANVPGTAGRPQGSVELPLSSGGHPCPARFVMLGRPQLLALPEGLPFLG